MLSILRLTRFGYLVVALMPLVVTDASWISTGVGVLGLATDPWMSGRSGS